jgi:hypothetical protein
MPTEALMRAARCRQRAEECMRIANEMDDPNLITHYLQIAEAYLVLAETEGLLAARLEQLKLTSQDIRDASDSH